MANWAQFSLRGVLTFVASGLDINGCVLSYFEGTANVHCYTSCALTTLHYNKVSFLQCGHMKIYNKIFTKMWGVYSLLRDTVYIVYVHLFKNVIIFHNITFTVFFCIWTNKWNHGEQKWLLSKKKYIFQTIEHVYKLLLLHCTVFFLYSVKQQCFPGIMDG